MASYLVLMADLALGPGQPVCRVVRSFGWASVVIVGGLGKMGGCIRPTVSKVFSRWETPIEFFN